jgi:hypothetical protein
VAYFPFLPLVPGQWGQSGGWQQPRWLGSPSKEERVPTFQVFPAVMNGERRTRHEGETSFTGIGAAPHDQNHPLPTARCARGYTLPKCVVPKYHPM